MESDDTLHLDHESRKRLMESDWDYALSKALKQAIAEMKIFESMGLSPPDPEDLVNDACTKVLSGVRKWDHRRYPDLGNHLSWIIRSDASHERRRLCGIIPVALDAGIESFHTAEREMAASPWSPRSQNPEELMVVRQQNTEFQKWLNQVSKQDEEVGLVLICLQDGITRPSEIADVVEWDIRKVNNVLKRTRRKIRSQREP